MRPEDIRALLDRRPFQPFHLFVSDGATYDITHPELASVLRTTVNIYVPASGGLIPVAERIAFVSFIHITRVEVFSPRAPGL